MSSYRLRSGGNDQYTMRVEAMVYFNSRVGQGKVRHASSMVGRHKGAPGAERFIRGRDRRANRHPRSENPWRGVVHSEKNLPSHTTGLLPPRVTPRAASPHRPPRRSARPVAQGTNCEKRRVTTIGNHRGRLQEKRAWHHMISWQHSPTQTSARSQEGGFSFSAARRGGVILAARNPT